MDDDEPHEIWFYSSEGEKHGPVSFTVLQATAREAGLNPRLDMVWTKGMDEWKPAGEIEGLFKRHAPPEPPEIPSFVPVAGLHQPLPGESVEGQMAKQGGWPGARRRSYLLVTLLFPLLWGSAVAAANPFLTRQFGPEIMKFAMPGLGLIPLLVLVFVSLKRLANLGMSHWWFLGNFVPFLNLWVGYRCSACPAGYAFHKKLDGAGIFLAIIYWLFWLLVLGLIIAAIVGFFGSLGMPELQRWLSEVTRTATAPKP